MDPQPTRTSSPAQRLHEILAEYQAARRAGRAPTPDELLARHPDLADQLKPLLAREQFAWAETLDAPSTPEVAARKPVDPNAPTLDPVGPPPGASVPFHRDFGDYELQEEVGRGGMGVVFRARQKSLHRTVAIKMILAGQLASEEQVRRFRVEAEEAGSLDHPNIVPIYQVGEEPGQHYFTMKLIEGGSLSTQKTRFLQDLRASVRLVGTIARAVHYAHQRGVLHRDLKPGNILLDTHGNPHVTDFGLAKHLEGPATTQSGAIVGTPGYMAPEQAAGRKDLSVAADVYSLGAILYELLTGRPPFQAETAVETILQVMEKEPDSPRTLNPKIDRDLETICLTCLAKEPARRYKSALRLAEDIDHYLAGEPIQARRTSRVERTVKWVRRRPAAAAVLAVALMAALTLSLGGWWTTGQLRAALTEVRRERERAEKERKDADDQRRLAEQRHREAEEQRQAAQESADEARRQGERAKASFQKRLDVIDDFLIRIDGRLANQGAPRAVRLEFLDDALKLSEGMLQEQKDDPAARRQSARLYAAIGNLRREAQSRPAAQAAYAKALELQKQLVADFPHRPEYQNDLAITSARQARLLQDIKRFPQAQAAFEEAIRLQKALAGEHPEQLDYRERAAYYRYLLANLQEEWNKRPQAEQDYRAALQEQEQLAADSPKNPVFHADVAATAFSLAALLGEGDPPAALPYLDQALRAQRRAFRLAPDDYRERLHDQYFDTAELLRQWGRHAELPPLADQLRRDLPDDPSETYNAACMIGYACQAVRNDRQPAAAEREALTAKYAEQAVQMLQKAVQEGYRDRLHMDRDRDMDPLRERPDYLELVAELDRRFPPLAVSPAREYTALEQEYQEAANEHAASRRRAQTVVEKKKAERKRPKLEEYAERFLKLADKHRDSAAAVEALVWILEQTAPDEERKLSAAALKVREQALQALQRDHFQKAELASVCQKLGESPAPDCEGLLRAAAEKHRQRDVRGVAGYALALSLTKQVDEAQKANQSDAAPLFRSAEQQLQTVIQQYPGVPFGRTTLGDAAKEKLYELRYLSVGREAPEIQGEDLDGMPLKLSEYRGKVVVLDFWADWCGYCRQMYRHERRLVEQIKGQPFALLGINCDDDRADARRAVQKEGLNWRSWWSGDRAVNRIRKDWQVNSFPTVYVLDAKGVIRYKFRGLVDKELDDAIAHLLKETAGR